MAQQCAFTLPSKSKGFHLMTDDVLKALPALPETGLLHLFILHTSAGLAINENADRTVRSDLDQAFDELAPENRPFYKHTVEGPDDMPAHIKSILTGSSVTVPITNGKLNLGTWQGIFLCEFRENAPPRNFIVTVLS
jgi:secondary thiamine-phosphate synthase enzyme